MPRTPKYLSEAGREGYARSITERTTMGFSGFVLFFFFFLSSAAHKEHRQWFKVLNAMADKRSASSYCARC